MESPIKKAACITLTGKKQKGRAGNATQWQPLVSVHCFASGPILLAPLSALCLTVWRTTERVRMKLNTKGNDGLCKPRGMMPRIHSQGKSVIYRFTWLISAEMVSIDRATFVVDTLALFHWNIADAVSGRRSLQQGPSQAPKPGSRVSVHKIDPHALTKRWTEIVMTPS